uniref:Fasciculation and elongation protein zeta-1-like n=1 Tax=Nothoprocta perdicaria TaxID=30464 RepID=A0A8C7E927_NOTPE
MEAPLVSLEEEFEEGPGGGGGGGGSPRGPADPALAELESFSAEMMSFKSMEDLVQEFDEKLTVCFRNYDATTEALAPVRGHLQAQEEEERLQDEEVWDALTDGFAPPGSPRRWLLPDTEAPSDSDTQEDEDDEEELTERSEQDSGINEEPLLTAEQVIEELEELMQSSPDPEEEEEEDEAEAELAGGGTEPIVLRELHAFPPALNNNCSHEGAFFGGKAQRIGQARAFCDMVAPCILLNAVAWGQAREMRIRGTRMGTGRWPPSRAVMSAWGPGHRFPQRFSMEGISSILQTGIRHTFGSSTADKQYLNTVIPYEKKGSPPSVEDLQMLTNILFAMKEGNEKVPTLLTDYILKVPCPTSKISRVV